MCFVGGPKIEQQDVDSRHLEKLENRDIATIT